MTIKASAGAQTKISMISALDDSKEKTQFHLLASSEHLV